MIISMNGWIFDVDMTATMAHSAEEAAEHCLCRSCRNFYAAIDSHYPQLRQTLAQFGLDVEGPDQMTPPDTIGAYLDYDPSFFVYGQILQIGDRPIEAGTAYLLAEPIADTWDGQPYFRLDAYDVTLPWVL